MSEISRIKSTHLQEKTVILQEFSNISRLKYRALFSQIVTTEYTVYTMTNEQLTDQLLPLRVLVQVVCFSNCQMKLRTLFSSQVFMKETV